MNLFQAVVRAARNKFLHRNRENSFRADKYHTKFRLRMKTGRLTADTVNIELSIGVISLFSFSML